MAFPLSPRWRTVLCVGLVAASSHGAGAQSPRITPRGDPTVKDDTIYSLAVNPAEYRDQNVVYLFRDAVLRFEPGGRGRQTYRQVVQLLTPAAVQQWGDISFPFSSERQSLIINWIHVLRPDGKVISARPAHEQTAIAPIAQEAPVYSDTRVRQVTLSGLAPNTIVDVSYTIWDRKPLVPGDFFATWPLNGGAVTRRSRLVVDVPDRFLPRIIERNIHFARQTVEHNGRRVYTWVTTDPGRPDHEPFAPESNPFVEDVTVAPPLSWADVGEWYAQLSRDRYKLTPALQQELSTIVGNAPTLGDSLKALYRWVAQDIRYVSLAMGMGGYRPRRPMSVWETRYGDCKDKSTLFIALARRLGVTAYPVLLNTNGYVDRDAPSAYQLDHMIVAVVDPTAGSEGYRFLDVTSDLTPYGSLPLAEQGAFALVVHPDGTGDGLTLPLDPVSENRNVVQIDGELHSDGRFNGKYVEQATGNRQYMLRSAFATAVDASERNRLTRDLANALFEGAKGDSLVSFNGRDLGAEPRVALAIRDARPVADAGSTEILTLPIKDYSAGSLVADLESRGVRRSPINVAEVVGPYEERSEFHLLLPVGWHARLPPDIDAESEFGRYTASYQQVGRELRVVRTVTGAAGMEPPEHIGALITWLKRVNADDVRYIVLSDRRKVAAPNLVGPPPPPPNLESFEHHWQDEANAAFLYRILASAEADTHKSDIYRRLAGVEDRHVEIWAKLLEEYGRSPGRYQPGMRTRMLALLGRRFGPAFLLPLLLSEEGREVKGYLDMHRTTRQDAPGAGEALLLARESAEHATTLAEIAGEPREPWHRTRSGGFLRNIVYGFNDGLTANFGLVAGVIGASAAVQHQAVVVAGIAGLIADALSMGASGYLAAKSEQEVYEHEIAMERDEIALMPEVERDEMALIYQAKGMAPEAAERLATDVMADPQRMLAEQVQEELKIGDPAMSPLREGWVTGAATGFGAVIPVFPFFFWHGAVAVALAFIFAMVSHFAVGALRSIFTGRGMFRSGLDMFVVGLGVAVVGYFVGVQIARFL